MAKRKFSKAFMIEALTETCKMMEDKHGFDPNRESIQVQGKGEEINREYGGYEAIRGLIDILRDGHYTYKVNIDDLLKGLAGGGYQSLCYSDESVKYKITDEEPRKLGPVVVFS